MYRIEWVPGAFLLAAVERPPARTGFRHDRASGRRPRRGGVVLALAAAVLAMPYLLVRSLRQRLAERLRLRPQLEP